MRIGIDARFLTHPQKGGFKTYSENLISALAKIDQNNFYILYLDRPPDQNTRLIKQPNIKHRVITGQNPLFGMPWREQISLPYWAEKDRLDLLHSPCLTAPLRLRCASVVTIHDMIWYSSANNSVNAVGPFKRKLMNWYYYFIPQRAARNASSIITVSHTSKERIMQQLRIPVEKIFVTYEAADPIFRKVQEGEQFCAIRKKHNLVGKYIMGIGSADPRKNIATLVRAYAQLPAGLIADYQLVIMWTHSLMAEEIMVLVNDLGVKERVRFITHVSNVDLVRLYNEASLFIFPSLEEGFGLPPLEAMACGTPVIAADNSSIPEILGDAALFVGAGDVEAMADNMTRVLADMTAQAELIQKGLDRAASFSWQKCAMDTIAVYEQALLKAK